MYLIYVNTLDSSKREHTHALSDMLFCTFLDYNNKTPCWYGLVRFTTFRRVHFGVWNHGTSHAFCAYLGALRGATQATAVEERTTKKAKSGPTKTAKSVGMSKKSDEIIYMLSFSLSMPWASYLSPSDIVDTIFTIFFVVTYHKYRCLHNTKNRQIPPSRRPEV